jgi:hypothetical protein
MNQSNPCTVHVQVQYKQNLIELDWSRVGLSTGGSLAGKVGPKSIRPLLQAEYRVLFVQEPVESSQQVIEDVLCCCS